MIHRKVGRQALVIVAALSVLAALGWRFPLFHVVPLKGVRDQQQAAAFDAPKVAAAFWDGKLLPATNRAVDVGELLSALTKDAAAARKQQGHSLGFSGTTIFLVKGAGHVKTVEEERVVVAFDRADLGIDAKVSLSTGLVFGNALRDATGLLDVSSYPNSQDFNDLSTQLNSIVETKVVPALREKAAIGKAIRFVGCAELEEDAKPESLAVIPLRVEWP